MQCKSSISGLLKAHEPEKNCTAHMQPPPNRMCYDDPRAVVDTVPQTRHYSVMAGWEGAEGKANHS